MTIEIDDQSVLAAFNRLIRAGQEPAPMLDAIGSLLQAHVHNVFLSKTDPYGNPWKPLASRAGGQTLRSTGNLFRSVKYVVEGNTLTIGTDVSSKAYAPTHQFGATIVPKNKPALRFMVNGHWVSVKKVTIPARPMFPLAGLPDVWRSDVVATVESFLDKSIKGS